MRIAVDLTRLGRGGQNGGIKPFVFRFLQWIGTERGAEFSFIYLTRSSLVPEVEAFRRDGDIQVCVGESEGVAAPHDKAGLPGFHWAPDPGPDWTSRWPADALYAPLGVSLFRRPGLPWVSLIADTLHRDLPDMLPPADD